jgi:hypothetical protein
LPFAEEKKEEEDTIRENLAKISPLPKRNTSSRRTRGGEVVMDLTGEENLSKAKVKKEKAAEKAAKEEPKKVKEKTPRIKTSVEHIGKEKTEYLGIGPTKLVIHPGKEGLMCLYCKKPYHSFDEGKQVDKWVTCKSCKKSNHKTCMENAIKCKCGAQAPKNR